LPNLERITYKQSKDIWLGTQVDCLNSMALRWILSFNM